MSYSETSWVVLVFSKPLVQPGKGGRVGVPGIVYKITVSHKCNPCESDVDCVLHTWSSFIQYKNGEIGAARFTTGIHDLFNDIERYMAVCLNHHLFSGFRSPC